MRECTLEGTFVEDAEEFGYYVRKIQFVGRKGCPDRIFIKNGLITILEFKKPGVSEPGPFQKKEFKKIKEVGGYTVKFVNDYNEAARILGMPERKYA